MPNDTGLTARRHDPVVVEAALAGLLAPRKTLPPKLFYDEEGCRLFYEITTLPEYYLTRTERALLDQVAPRMADLLPQGTVLVEYGASDETKAEYLLRLRAPDGAPLFRFYVPIDVAEPALQQMSTRLRDRYPRLWVHPVVADFQELAALPTPVSDGVRLGFFPGSTIGNLEPDAAGHFLRQARIVLGSAARFLLGVDLRKDPAILIPAYDDAAGVTAAFNRNILRRLNREAGADFDPDAFAHRAVWNDAESRIEMHLVSQRDQVAHLAGHAIRFVKGETIHTENSYKHTPARIAALAALGGWRPLQTWTDPAGLFAMYLLEPEPAG